jgi:hypothetical protein
MIALLLFISLSVASYDIVTVGGSFDNTDQTIRITASFASPSDTDPSLSAGQVDVGNSNIFWMRNPDCGNCGSLTSINYVSSAAAIQFGSCNQLVSFPLYFLFF